MEYGSGVLGWLANVTLRSLCLAWLAAAAMALCRVKSPATRHAVWTAVAAGMLLLAVLGPVLPAVSLHVLRPAAVAVPSPTMKLAAGSAGKPAAQAAAAVQPVDARVRGAGFRWDAAAAAAYAAGVLFLLTRLALSYRFTRRLVAASRLVEHSRPADLHVSAWISVPVTIGWRNPKIVMPAGYGGWPAEKLAAVLAHERTHVERGDWAVALLAALNRCMFWFHPLAWWLERRLAVLAEEACDDAALLALGERASYAQVLLDMAAAVKAGRGRLAGEAIAMARVADVRKRIERILDETRRIHRAMSRTRRAALGAVSLALIWLMAVVQLAPAQVESNILSQQAVSALEQRLAQNPDDLATRQKLIQNYYLTGVRQPRLDHILWLIQTHPESGAAAFESAGILPRNTVLNTSADYERAAALWRQQAALHATDGRVLENAAQFLAQPGGSYEEAEHLLERAAALPSAAGSLTEKRAKLYVAAIVAAAGYPRAEATAADRTFAEHARAMLEGSTDSVLVARAAAQLRPEALVPGLSRDEVVARFPQLIAVVALGERLQAKAPPPVAPASVPPQRLAIQIVQGATPARLVTRVEPVYPEAARAAQVSGTVRLTVRVGADGRVKDVTPIDGNRLLVSAAVDAVRQWMFAPAQQNGSPVESLAQAEVSFGSAGAPTRVRVGTNVQAALLVQHVDPVYPEQARQAGIEGDVRLRVNIGSDGHVMSIEPLSGSPVLAAAAQEAVRQWVYKPTFLNGNPVEVSTTVMVPFRLDGSVAQPTAPQTGSNPNGRAPVLTYSVGPEYTPEARAAKFQGFVTLSVSVGADGSVKSARVLRSLGMGLDEKAIEAVRQWRYRPAVKDGRPVDMDVTVQVDFRLL